MAKKQMMDFWKTIKDARRLTEKDSKHKAKKIQKKMPLNMLRGIRKKKLQKHNMNEEFKKNSNILYDSYQRKFDISFKQKKKEKKKNKKKKIIKLF